MKIKLEIELDTEIGDYEVCFRNLSDPTIGIDWFEIKPVLAGILKQLDYKVETEGEA